MSLPWPSFDATLSPCFLYQFICNIEKDISLPEKEDAPQILTNAVCLVALDDVMLWIVVNFRAGLWRHQTLYLLTLQGWRNLGKST